MSRIKLLFVVLVLLLAACSQATLPGSPSGACNVQALYDKIEQANAAAPSGENAAASIVLEGTCTYQLTGRALEFSEGSNVEIVGNGATINAQGKSRGILNRGILHLSDLTIMDGYATKEGDNGSGGGIWNAGQLRLTDSTVSTNSADLRGGGVFNAETLTLEGSSSISGNTADGGGGVFNAETGTLTLKDTASIVDNTAEVEGGGLSNEVTLTLSGSSSVSGNTANVGGGAYNSGTLTLEDTSSISGNTATSSGGGVFHLSSLGTLTGADYDGLGDDNIYDNTPDDVLSL